MLCQCTLGRARQMFHAAAHVGPHCNRSKGTNIRATEQHQCAGNARDRAALDSEPATGETLGVVGFCEVGPYGPIPIKGVLLCIRTEMLGLRLTAFQSWFGTVHTR